MSTAIRNDQIGLLLNGELVDFFGVVGEDGIGTNHEFTGGRAARLPGVVAPTPVWNPNEWQVVNNNPANNYFGITEPACAPGNYEDILPSCSSEFDPQQWDGASALPSCNAPPPPSPCSSICGDVNSDGQVNVNDIVILNNYILGQSDDPCVLIVGDLTPDNIINVSDIVALSGFITPASNAPVIVFVDCSVYIT